MKAQSIRWTMVLACLALVSGCISAQPQARADGTPAQEKVADAPQSAEEAGWTLAFSDDFDRDELGDNWQVVKGDWTVEDGRLCGSGILISAQGFPEGWQTGFQRLEFEAVTDVQPLAFLQVGSEKPAAAVSDLSSFIHASAPEGPDSMPLATGYFFQFGGYMNTENQLRKAGTKLQVDEDPDVSIEQDKVHRIVVENDGGHLRFFVDGELILEDTESMSIVGDEHERVGLYFYTAACVDWVKVYVKPLPDGLDGAAR